ncbi:ATP-dependent Clp protease proteolytic subunit [Ideonella sp.]|uniref:ATP-dependent Clp protease proteolytic subunit n=1 Tax=Ideonella sp. TaxID=1929293 RepID=UPI0035AE7FC1
MHPALVSSAARAPATPAPGWRSRLPAMVGLAPWGLAVLADWAADHAGSLRGTATWQFVGMAAAVAGLVGIAVCLWRLGGGRGMLPRAVLGVLLAIGLGTAGPSSAQRAAEIGRIAFGLDPLPAARVELSGDGRTLWLRGAIGTGSADAVARALGAASGVRLVRLDSPGGRVYEAREIAELLRARRVDTFAEGLCASACTVVLLAGRERGAAEQARIGFHRPQFAGQDDEALGTSHALIRAYRDAGLGTAFIDRVRATPSRSMWYPARAELLRQRVLTG